MSRNSGSSWKNGGRPRPDLDPPGPSVEDRQDRPRSSPSTITRHPARFAPEPGSQCALAAPPPRTIPGDLPHPLQKTGGHPLSLARSTATNGSSSSDTRRTPRTSGAAPLGRVRITLPGSCRRSPRRRRRAARSGQPAFATHTRPYMVRAPVPGDLPHPLQKTGGRPLLCTERLSQMGRGDAGRQGPASPFGKRPPRGRLEDGR
jgi:hypothetical protein